MKFLLVQTMEDRHPYSVFAKALCRELEVLGHTAVVSNQTANVVGGRASVAELIQELHDGGYEVLVSFSAFFGALAVQDGSSLYDALGVKFVGWQLDHPIYAPQSLARALRNRWAIYANQNHLRFVEALRLPGHGRTMLPGAEPPRGPRRDHASREWPVFVAATFNGQPQALWEQLEDSPGKHLLEGVVKALLADPQASVLDAFNGTVRTLGLNARLGQDPAFDEQMIGLLRESLTYVRNLDRVRIVKSLVDSGLPVTVCGFGWRDFLGERPNVLYINQHVDFPEMPELYARSKVVLNLNAGNGGCERATYAALAGAAVVSDASLELNRQFDGRNEISIFNRADPGAAVAAVSHLIETDGGAAMAERGERKALQKGLWRHRAEQLLGYVGAS